VVAQNINSFVDLFSVAEDVVELVVAQERRGRIVSNFHIVMEMSSSSYRSGLAHISSSTSRNWVRSERGLKRCHHVYHHCARPLWSYEMHSFALKVLLSIGNVRQFCFHMRRSTLTRSKAVIQGTRDFYSRLREGVGRITPEFDTATSKPFWSYHIGLHGCKLILHTLR
jgi:hypothetical protein